MISYRLYLRSTRVELPASYAPAPYAIRGATSTAER
jgi:hypothetical protein